MELTLGRDYSKKDLTVVDGKIYDYLNSLNGEYDIVFCQNARVLRLLQWYYQKRSGWKFKLQYITAKYFQKLDGKKVKVVDESLLRLIIDLGDEAFSSFFNDLVACRALELGLPMEVEYPIFYANIPEDVEDKDIFVKEFAEKYSDSIFNEFHSERGRKPLNVYKSEKVNPLTGSISTSYTVPYEHISGVKKEEELEFINSKRIRFFSNGQRIAVVSYYIESINSNFICEDSRQLPHPNVHPAWNEIYKIFLESAKNNNDLQSYDINGYLPIILNYIEARERLENQTHQAIRATGCNISSSGEQDNLALLIGETEAQHLLDCIKRSRSVQTRSSDGRIKITTMVKVKFITPHTPVTGKLPQRGSVDFNIEAKRRMTIGTTVGNCVSAEFSAMKSVYSKLGNKLTDVGYGETLYGITQRIKNNTKLRSYNDLRNLVMMELEKRIDMGSVYPKYVLHTEANQAPRWIQVFSYTSGEDFCQDRLLRVLVYCFEKLKQKHDSVNVKSMTLELLLVMLSKSNKSKQIFNVGTDVIFADGRYTLAFESQGLRIPIIDFAKQIGLFVHTTTGDLITGDNEYYYYTLSESSPWDNMTNHNVDGVIDMVDEFNSVANDYKDAVNDLLNVICYDGESLSMWLRKCIQDTLDVIASESNEKSLDIARIHRKEIEVLNRLPIAKSDAIMLIGKLDLDRYGIDHLFAKLDADMLLFEKLGSIEAKRVTNLRECVMLCAVNNLMFLLYENLFEYEHKPLMWESFYNSIKKAEMEKDLLYCDLNPESNSFVEELPKLPKEIFMNSFEYNLNKVLEKCSE